MFQGEIVWITGASSGIGEAIAYEMAKAGAVLILSARRAEELLRVKETCLNLGLDTESIMLLPLDVSAPYEALLEQYHKALAFKGHIDVLFNNAGISQRSSCVETEMSTYRRLFEVDVFGPIMLTKLVLPAMITRGEGHLIVTSSVAGKIGAAKRTGYCAAKHAMMGFFDALRAEVHASGLKVTTITPGFIKTAVSENALNGDGTPFGEMDSNISGGMHVADCAQAIMRGLNKGLPEIAVGTGPEMYGLWLKRFWPRLLFRMTAKLAHRS